MKGYKIIRPGWQDGQYAWDGSDQSNGIGLIHESDLNSGILYFYQMAVDCWVDWPARRNGFFIYPIKYVEVEALGEIRREGRRILTNKLRIIREIPEEEMKKLSTGNSELWSKSDVYPQPHKMSSGYYHEGIPDGFHIRWHLNGTMEVRDTFRNGDKVCSEHWAENGEPMWRQTYLKEKTHGKVEQWYPGNVKILECDYINGVSEGLCKYWYNTGERYQIWKFENGERKNLLGYWDKDGRKQRSFKWQINDNTGDVIKPTEYLNEDWNLFDDIDPQQR